MVAYCSHKAKVAGSTPAAATDLFPYLIKFLTYLYSLLVRVGNILSAHGVIGNTTDFGSVIGGSSPSVLTTLVFIMYLYLIILIFIYTLACESRGILLVDKYD